MSQSPPRHPPAHAHNHTHHQPPMVVSEAVLRRRSADVGGLHLAIHGESQGQGWLDSTGSDTNIATEYAEWTAALHRETVRVIEKNVAQIEDVELSQEDRARLLNRLESWYFEPLRMQEHELLACVLFLFEVLFRIEGIREMISVDMDVIRRFIFHIRLLYRAQNHYHNFEHAVDVLQAIHCYLCSAGMVPSVTLLLSDANSPGGMWSPTREHDSGPLVTCLTPREIFALYLAAIGHDVGHPGLSNLFMVYDDKSTLERWHIHMLLSAMKYYGLSPLLEDPKSGAFFRKILTNSVLATDMSVHGDFMEQFKQILDGKTEAVNEITKWQTTKCTRQIFVCQLLLKNADISNPCRPFAISKQWASALQQEWACQYKFESFLDMEHNVNPSNEPLAEAKSQVFFTSKIAKPLVDMTTIAIPELSEYSSRCAENLKEWEQILADLKEAQSMVDSISTTVPDPSAHSSTLHPTSSPPPTSPTDSHVVSQSFASSTNLPTNQSPDSNPASPPNPLTSPIAISTAKSISASSSMSSASSSNPVSPRVAENDYSTAFRLALPRIRSDGSTYSPVVTPGSIPGSVIGSALSVARGGRGDSSRTPSSGGNARLPGGAASPGSTSVLSPSLSRAAARVTSGSNTDSLSSLSSSPQLHSIYTPPGLNTEDRGQIDGYRFPPTSPTSAAMPPAPPPSADPTMSLARLYQESRSYSNSQTHSSTPSVSPSDSPSQILGRDSDDPLVDDQQSNFDAIGGGDEYEYDVQAHRVNFHRALGLGLGVGSLKKKKSANILKSSPFGYSPSGTGGVGGATSPPLSAISTSNATAGLNGPSRARGAAQNPNRASWCPGESFSLNIDQEVGSVEQARGTIESWRGRWGSASFGVSVPAVAYDDGEEASGATQDSGERVPKRPNGIHHAVTRDTVDEDEPSPIPTGLVSPASANGEEADPQTPPQQLGSLGETQSGSGSPTPKAKLKGTANPRETEKQKKKRLDDEVRRAEKQREKLREELIREEEKEKAKLMKKASMELLSANGSGKNGARSRSRSKARKKVKGKK